MNYENEEWRDIVIEKNGILYDYTGMYQISNYGRVRSLDRTGSDGRELKGKILKPKQDKKGYLFVTLCKNREAKNFTIHRLVATMFIPNPENLPVVNHVSEVKSENFVWNLEWCTAKYNINYGTAIERRAKKMKGENNPMHGRKGEKHPQYGKPRSEETKHKISETLKGKPREANKVKVVCLETKQVFSSIKDANEWCNVDIYQHLRGRSKTAGGYHWQYLDDYLREQRMQSDINNSKQLAA